MKSKLMIFIGTCIFSFALLFNLSGAEYRAESPVIEAIAGSGGQCMQCDGFKLVDSSCGGTICVRRTGYSCDVHEQEPC